MDVNNLKLENRYFLGLNAKALDNFLNQTKINIDQYLTVKGNYIQIDKIIYRESLKLSQVKRTFLANKIKELYGETKNTNINNDNLLKWLFNGSVLVFYSKNLFENNLRKFVMANYLISIKECDILKVFTKIGYENNILNITLSKNCELIAILCKYEGKLKRIKRFIFVFKTKEHIFCISPLYKPNLVDFWGINNKFVFQDTNQFCLEKLDFAVVDEIVDNNISLIDIRQKLAYTKDAHCFLDRIETAENYFAPFVISVGEFADMMNAIEKT